MELLLDLSNTWAKCVSFQLVKWLKDILIDFGDRLVLRR